MKQFIFESLEFLKNYKFFSLFILLLLILSSYASHFSPAPPQTNFVDLANSFLHGKTYLLNPIRVWNDYAIYQGHYYVYFGPLSAILFMPLVAIFGTNIPQQIMIPFIACGTFVLAYKITRGLGCSKSSSLWLTTFFIFGTIYLILILTTISSYNVQVVSLVFLMLAVWILLKNGSSLLSGFFLGLSGLAQPTYYPTVIFFLTEYLLSKTSFQEKARKIGLFLAIVGLSVTFLGLYNYLRFGWAFETGYGYETTAEPGFVKAKERGIFSLEHIPGNLYVFLFKAPDPVLADSTSFVLKFPYLRANEWGMGIFFTSPLLVYLILTKRREKYILSSILSILFILIPAFMYYGVGRWQFGYRYSLGIYPFLLIMLAIIFKKGSDLPFLAKCLILYSITFNLLFMYSIWGVYPLLKGL